VNLIGRVYWNQNEFIHAVQMLERSVEQMQRLGNKAEAATAASAAGFALGCMGEFERAMHHADLGVQLARETHDPLAESAALQQRAFVREYRGHLPEALEEYAEARRIAAEIGDRFRLYIIDILEGRARTLAGDLKEARARLDAAGAFAGQIGTKFFVATQKISLAECLLALGDADTAVTCSQEAVALSDETGEKLAQARARRALAEAVIHRDTSPAALERAEGDLRRALEILQDIGGRPELARTSVILARVLSARGDEVGARDLLGRARAMFNEMDLRWDLERLAAAKD